MGRTVLQLDQLTKSVQVDSWARQERLTILLSSAAGVDPNTAAEKTSDTRQRPYLAAEVLESLIGAYPPAAPPADWAVPAVDGSHIDVMPLLILLITLSPRLAP